VHVTGVDAVLASIPVTLGYDAVLTGSHWTVSLAGFLATGLGTVRLVRAGRAL